MKRALIVLLLLAVVAGGLFAQLSFNGHVQSGIGIAIPDGDTTVHWFSRDANATYRFDLGASYTHDSGRAGASGGIRLQAGTLGGNGASIWVEPIDDVLRLQVGTGGPGGYNTPGSFDTHNNAANVEGFNIKLTPALDGMTFTVGAGINPSNTTFDKTRYTAGVTFGLPNLLNVVANIGSSYRAASETAEEGRVNNVAAGIGVLALNAASGETGLTRLAVDMIANDLADLGWIGIGPAVGFRVAGVAAGDLGITLSSRIFLPLKDTYDMDYWVGLNLGVPLVTGVNLGINAGYEGKGAIPGVAGAMNAADGGGTGQSISGGTDPAFIVRPTVTFTIGNGTLETGWSLQALLADEMKLYNSLYAYFRVGF